MVAGRFGLAVFDQVFHLVFQISSLVISNKLSLQHPHATSVPTAVVLVDDGHVFVPNVLLLLVKLRVRLHAGHEGGHAVYHLHCIILPHILDPASLESRPARSSSILRLPPTNTGAGVAPLHDSHRTSLPLQGVVTVQQVCDICQDQIKGWTTSTSPPTSSLLTLLTLI